MSEFAFGGHRYELVSSPLTWSEAQNLARSRGGQLAVIESAQENQALLQWLSSLNPNAWPSAEDGGGAVYVWLGGSDLEAEGQWRWSNGQSITYANWGSIEPDDFGGQQDALAFALSAWPYGSPGQWNDVDQNNRLFALIEYAGTAGGTGPKSTNVNYVSSSYTELGSLWQHIKSQPGAEAFFKNAFSALENYQITPHQATLFYRLGDLSWQQVLEGDFSSFPQVGGTISQAKILFNGEEVQSWEGLLSVEDFISRGGWLPAEQLVGNEEDNMLSISGQSLLDGGAGNDVIFLTPEGAGSQGDVTVYTGPGEDVIVLDLGLGGEGITYHFPDFTPGEDKLVLGGLEWMLFDALSQINEDPWGFSAIFDNGAVLDFGFPLFQFDPQSLLTLEDASMWGEELLPIASAFDWSPTYLLDAMGVEDYLYASATGGHYPPPEWSWDSWLASGNLDIPYLSEDALQMLDSYRNWQSGQFEDLYSSMQSFNDWMVDSWSQALGGDWDWG